MINVQQQPGYTPKRRDLVMTRDGGRCVVCGDSAALTIHHVKPRCIGGAHDIHNMVTLCAVCHVRVHRHADTFAYRLSARLVWAYTLVLVWRKRYAVRGLRRRTV